LREQIDKERELMNEKLDAIEEHYSNELYLLRRLLDANVISQGEYTNRLGDLQADRSSAEAAATEPVDEAQAEYDAAQQLIDDLNDAKTQKLSELSAELLDAKAALDGMPFFAPFAMKAPLLTLIATLQARIAAVEDATTIEEVMAAKNGADFISRDTGLLQYHPNEHVKVTPAPNNGTSGTIINFNGDVYGDADEIARVVTDAVDKAQGRRRLA
jgi:hypothetical protein